MGREVVLENFSIHKSNQVRPSRVDGHPYVYRLINISMLDVKTGEKISDRFAENWAQLWAVKLKQTDVIKRLAQKDEPEIERTRATRVRFAAEEQEGFGIDQLFQEEGFISTPSLDDKTLQFLSSITHLQCRDNTLFDSKALVHFFGKVMRVMPALKVIEVPVGANQLGCAALVRSWQNIWFGGLEVKTLQLIRSIQNDEEAVSPVPSTPSDSPVTTAEIEFERAIRDNHDPFVNEEEPWIDSRMATVAAGALAMTAVAMRAKNLNVSHAEVMHVALRFDALAGFMLRRAHATPVLSSVLSFTGAVANNTVVPIARSVFNYLGRGK